MTSRKTGSALIFLAALAAPLPALARDYSEAIRWYRLAAENGSPEARETLRVLVPRAWA